MEQKRTRGNCFTFLFPYFLFPFLLFSSFPPFKSMALIIFHKWIAIIRRWNKRFLDCTWTDPPQQIKVTSGLIIGTTLP